MTVYPIIIYFFIIDNILYLTDIVFFNKFVTT